MSYRTRLGAGSDPVAGSALLSSRTTGEVPCMEYRAGTDHGCDCTYCTRARTAAEHERRARRAGARMALARTERTPSAERR